MRSAICITLFASLLPMVLTGQENKKLDGCALLSADDAAKIAGTQMWFVHGAKESCEYIDKKPAVFKSTPFNHSVTLEMKRYKSAQIADKEWAKATAVHDQSKKPQVLSGIGDAAYLFGDVEEGKIGIARVSVRKGTLILDLQNIDMSTTSSAEALIAVARKIANQL
jgi:hypothetical protein